MTYRLLPAFLICGLLVSLLGDRPAVAEPPAAVSSIEYRLAKEGRVSLAVYDQNGRLVRELLRGAKQQPGVHRVTWDGLARNGRPLPAADYAWKMLQTPGFRAEYLTSLGINPKSAPYDRWVGNHGGAASVAADGGGMYVAAQITETAPVLLKQSLDGTRRDWTRSRGEVTQGRYQGGISLASDGRGTLYMLQQNGLLQVIDAQQGKVRSTWKVLTSPEQSTEKSKAIPEWRRYYHGEEIAAADFDARGKTLVLSDRAQGVVRWLNPADGTTLVEFEVDSPTGVAVGKDETSPEVFVISGDRVLALTPGGERRTVIDRGLSGPRRLTVDPASGELFILERHPNHQVKRFSPAGKLLATYGRKGGRREGTYHGEDFRDATDITADGRGGFLIAELTPAPRRVAHFDREGMLLDEWYGGQPYYAWAEPDPQQPTHVWFNPGAWLALAEVDYGRGTWRLLETYHLDTLADGLVRSMPGHRGRWQVLYHQGQRFLVSQSKPQVLAHREGSLEPVSVVGGGPELVRAAELAGRGAEAKSFRWADGNGDGRPQPAEFTFNNAADLPDGDWIADDFTLLETGNREQDDRVKFTILRTSPQWKNGLPLYPIGDEPGLHERVAETDCPERTGSRGSGAYRDAAGNYYGHYNAGPERHGRSWPTYWGGVTRFVRWDAEGNLLWKVGRHAIHGGLGSAPGSTPPGHLHVPVHVIGETAGAVILADRVENPAMAWTTDGLYAGSFFDRRTEDGLPERVYRWWRTSGGTEAITTSDNAQGGRAIAMDDGTVLWFAQGRNSVPVYKVHGWNDWMREEGSATLTDLPPHAAAEGTGLTAAYYDAPRIAGSPVTSRVDRQVWHGIPRGKPGNDPVLDGFREGPRYDWSEGIEPLGKESQFAVRWTGEVEAPLSEAFTFSIYARGGVRLWIGGVQRIFAWNETVERWETEPIPLAAGRKYAVQLDFYSTHKHPACSLNWESRSLDRRRVAAQLLYPQSDAPLAQRPDPRPATARIDARTFDLQSGDIGPGDVRGGAVSGLRQRGLGKSGALLGFRRLDFGKGVSRLHVLASGRPAGDGQFPVTLEFRLDSPEGPEVAAVSLPDESDAALQPQAIDTQRIDGIHDVYVVNTTPKRWHFVHLHWFEFGR